MHFYDLQDIRVLLDGGAPQVKLVPLVQQVHRAHVENVKLVVLVSNDRYSHRVNVEFTLRDSVFGATYCLLHGGYVIVVAVCLLVCLLA